MRMRFCIKVALIFRSKTVEKNRKFSFFDKVVKMLLIISLSVCLIISAPVAFGARTITVNNRCKHTIWIQNLDEKHAAVLGGVRKLDSNQNVVLNVPDSGWIGGRIWPKVGCNNNGEGCAWGQSIAPCGKNGCQPPAETKVEFFYPPINDPRTIYYDISLVDGYSLPTKITPDHIVRSNFIKLKFFRIFNILFTILYADWIMR